VSVRRLVRRRLGGRRRLDPVPPYDQNTPSAIRAGASFDQALAQARRDAGWDPGLAPFTALMRGAGFEESR
jgi:hypothetical protein